MQKSEERNSASMAVCKESVMQVDSGIAEYVSSLKEHFVVLDCLLYYIDTSRKEKVWLVVL